MNARLRPVGHFTGQFHAANDRPRMHEERIRLRQLHALRRDLIVGDVVVNTEMLAREPLLLYAQRHHHVGALQGGIQIVDRR